MTDAQKKANGIKDGDGIFVTGVADDGAAKIAGLQKGDFVTKIEGVTINSSAELQEQLSRFKPGDKVNVTYVRNGSEKTTVVTLKNKSGTYAQVQAETLGNKLGGELVTLDAATAKKNNIAGGVQVKNLGNGALKSSRIQEGFIIMSVNGQEVKSVDDLNKILASATGTVKLEGIYPGYDETYGYPLNLGGDGSGDSNGDNGDGN